MKKLLSIVAALFALALAACGGGGTDPLPPAQALQAPPAALAQCNGVPRAGVIYVGMAPFPGLAAVPDACVYSTEPGTVAELAALVATARAAAPKVYLIGEHEGATLALQYLNTRTGIVAAASLWYAGDAGDLSGIHNFMAPIYFNELASSCTALAATLRARWVPAYCYGAIETVFGDAQQRAALWELGL